MKSGILADSVTSLHMDAALTLIMSSPVISSTFALFQNILSTDEVVIIVIIIIVTIGREKKKKMKGDK